MKKILISIACLLAMTKITPCTGLKEDGLSPQLCRFYSKLLVPLVAEASRASGYSLHTPEQLYDIAFFATLRDTTLLLTQCVELQTTVDDKTITITQTPIDLGEIVRLTHLCNFIKTGTFLTAFRATYITDAETIRSILQDYCTRPATRRALKLRLKKLVQLHLRKKD